MEKNTIAQQNLRLEQAFSNPVYDILGKAINETAQKYDYGRYDIARLVMTIYDNDY